MPLENLYGVTAYGGTGDCVLLGVKAGCGTVYKLSPPKQKGGAWTETVLYSFPTIRQGYLPNGNLVFDSAGNLYGATTFGGSKGTTCDKFYGGQCGTVFELSPPKTKGGKWTEKVLHSFASGTDGANPGGGLVLDSKGAVYGTTPMGGNQLCNFGNGKIGCGIAFELVPPTKKGGVWTEKFLHRFTDGNDGAGPAMGMVFDADSSLFGAAGGGAKGGGVIFRLAAVSGGRWKETAVYEFSSNTYGYGPAVSFVDSSGNLYGTTYSVPDSYSGSVFRLMPPTQKSKPWAMSFLYEFTGPPDGIGPSPYLVRDKSGDFYGATQYGGSGTCGSGGCGTVFELRP